ncbi:hypothetical protein [Streptomyces apocyni]|uniref:hypothetical protein n=1 Tax=Streptomyces apocyni TaxID=2654677 RepID=UPI0018D0C657|nr:hypothetical protein [Streptomyces apocyni]
MGRGRRVWLVNDIGGDDYEPVFKHGKYNPANPIGLALIVGTLLFVAGGMYLLHHPDLLDRSKEWDGGELRSAVSAATDELSREAMFGPGAIGGYEGILRSSIAAHGDGGAKDRLTVRLASERPESAGYDGGSEQADYTVTAEGTDDAFCLGVYAMKRERALGYDFVDISVDDGACPAS